MKKSLISLLLVLILAVPALAQDTNYMGLYFDPLGGMNCLDVNTVTPFTTYPLYLILMYPDFDFLYGFEAGFSVDGPVIVLNAQFAVVNALNVGTLDNMIVGYGEPQPTELGTLLVTFSFMYTSTSQDPVCFRLHGTTPSSIDPMYPTLLLADGVLGWPASIPVRTTTAASIDFCVSATEEHSFDSLKSLYR